MPDSSSSWYEIYEINEIYSFASRYTRSKTFFPPSFFPDTIRASNSMCPRMNRSWMAGTSAFFSILVAGSTSREIGYQPTRTGSLHLWTGRKRPRSSLLLYLFGHGNRGTQSFRPRERPSREFRYPQSLRSASLFDMRLTLNNASLASSRRASSVLLSRDRITDL